MLRMTRRVVRRNMRRTVRKTRRTAVRATVKTTVGTARVIGRNLPTVDVSHEPLTFKPSERMNRWRTVRF